jgi:hypothetical protein
MHKFILATAISGFLLGGFLQIYDAHARNGCSPAPSCSNGGGGSKGGGKGGGFVGGSSNGNNGIGNGGGDGVPGNSGNNNSPNAPDMKADKKR